MEVLPIFVLSVAVARVGLWYSTLLRLLPLILSSISSDDVESPPKSVSPVKRETDANAFGILIRARDDCGDDGCDGVMTHAFPPEICVLPASRSAIVFAGSFIVRDAPTAVAASFWWPSGVKTALPVTPRRRWSGPNFSATLPPDDNFRTSPDSMFGPFPKGRASSSLQSKVDDVLDGPETGTSTCVIFFFAFLLEEGIFGL